MKIKVLYEDSDILAIDKPSGISVHPDGRLESKTKEKTITDWVLKNYPRMKNVGEPMGDIVRPGVVHRLDKDTSGVLVLAKNQKSYEYLKAQFSGRFVKKVYNAVVSGFMKDDHGIINKPIGRSPTDFRRRLAGRGARGELREAITEYKVLKRFITLACENFSSCTLPGLPVGTLGDKNSHKPTPQKFSYLEIKPKTGRTHQIRVHMKFLNHPVACDSLYDPKGLCPKGFKRLALHALSIEFKTPKGKILKIEAPLPAEFKKVSK